jgi:hypothetical protein
LIELSQLYKGVIMVELKTYMILIVTTRL